MRLLRQMQFLVNQKKDKIKVKKHLNKMWKVIFILYVIFSKRLNKAKSETLQKFAKSKNGENFFNHSFSPLFISEKIKNWVDFLRFYVENYVESVKKRDFNGIWLVLLIVLKSMLNTCLIFDENVLFNFFAVESGKHFFSSSHTEV